MQVALEKSNVSNLRTYTATLTDNSTFIGLADNEQLRNIMIRVSQNTNWKQYFIDYEKNQADLNPIYTTSKDSDKSALIDQVLAASGLPDVLDAIDLEAVANKAKNDSRIDTKNYDSLTVEQQITDACRQLSITVVNRSIYNQSQSLLDNLNKRDRDVIAQQLDSNEEADTIN